MRQIETVVKKINQ